jgi:ketosteroid isomerase-like protein
MSERNVEIVRRGFEALQRGGIAAVLELLDPEFEAEVGPDLSPEPDRYRGHEGVRRWFAGFEGSLEDVRLEPEEFIDAGDSVIVRARLSGRGSGSGIEVEQQAIQVWTVRDGRAVSVSAFADMGDARRAAGLDD